MMARNGEDIFREYHHNSISGGTHLAPPLDEMGMDDLMNREESNDGKWGMGIRESLM